MPNYQRGLPESNIRPKQKKYLSFTTKARNILLFFFSYVFPHSNHISKLDKLWTVPLLGFKKEHIHHGRNVILEWCITTYRTTLCTHFSWKPTEDVITMVTTALISSFYLDYIHRLRSKHKRLHLLQQHNRKKLQSFKFFLCTIQNIDEFLWYFVLHDAVTVPTEDVIIICRHCNYSTDSGCHSTSVLIIYQHRN